MSETDTEKRTEWWCRERADGQEYRWPNEERARKHVADRRDQGCQLVLCPTCGIDNRADPASGPHADECMWHTVPPADNDTR